VNCQGKNAELKNTVEKSLALRGSSAKECLLAQKKKKKLNNKHPEGNKQSL